MDKPADVTITQITATSYGRTETLMVLGLGDDQKVYQWSNQSHTWQLFN